MRHHAMKCLVASLAVVGAVLSVVGCGNGNLVAVSGDVSVAGKLADGGSISFSPADGQGPSVGTQIKDGKFDMVAGKGLPPGPKNVEITAVLKTGKQIEAGPPIRKGTMVDETKRFSGKETCNVVAGQTNQFNFHLNPPKENR